MTVAQPIRPVVLVVEQDPAHRVFIADNLTADGFEIHAAETASDGLRVADAERPDVAVVGVNGGSGRDFARLVREGDHGDPRLPMILIGTDPSELDTLRALDAGADDYVLRGTPYAVLHARVRALLRRVELDTAGPRRWVYEVGSLRVDGAERLVTIDGQPTEALTPREFAMLWQLVREPSRFFALPELARLIGSRASHPRVLSAQVSRLRAKLGPGWIESRYGHGVRLTCPVAVVA
jgi:DNA-binding response OmpR family regulator